MSAKATLGYPSRTAAVLGLRGQGYSTRQIGIANKTVSALEHSAARNRKCERVPALLGRAVIFPADVLAALGPHAARRGIHPNHLARLIVSTVVDENMIDAVLDDNGERWA